MVRRGEQIYKRKDGRWEARYVKEIGLDGKKKYGSLYGKTYTEVKQKKEELMKCRNKPTSPLSLHYIIDEWLFVTKNQVKQSSYQKYRGLAYNHIIPKIGKMKISQLNHITLAKFTDLLLNSGRMKGGSLSKKTVNEILIILKMALKYASITYNIQIPHVFLLKDNKRKEAPTLSEDETAMLISTLLKDMNIIKFGILLSLYSGMRIGEICALKWIDVKDNYIYVTKTLYRLSENGQTKLYYTEPKSTSSIRIIPIHNDLKPFIQQFRKDDGFVLQRPNGKLVEPRLMQLKFKKIMDELNINNVTFHTLRHTFATRCIEVGFDIKTLSEILGHSDVKTTLNRYVHSSLSLKQKNMEKLYF